MDVAVGQVYGGTCEDAGQACLPPAFSRNDLINERHEWVPEFGISRKILLDNAPFLRYFVLNKVENRYEER
jgi:hypothetical protein